MWLYYRAQTTPLLKACFTWPSWSEHPQPPCTSLEPKATSGSLASSTSTKKTARKATSSPKPTSSNPSPAKPPNLGKPVPKSRLCSPKSWLEFCDSVQPAPQLKTVTSGKDVISYSEKLFESSTSFTNSFLFNNFLSYLAHKALRELLAQWNQLRLEKWPK